MKSFLWIANSSLIALSILLIIGFFLFKKNIPSPKSIKPKSTIEQIKPEPKISNLEHIYKGNDLFNTFAPIEKPRQELPEVTTIPKIPSAPNERLANQNIPKTIHFLEPLAVNLKGIIYTGDKSTTQAIISNQDTKQESLYKAGSKILDSHILQIFNNSVIILRSNGQQEVIYVNKAEAEKEIESMQKSSWTNIVTIDDNGNYIIDPQAFINRIKNLSELMEMLDLTTVFKDGESIGIHVGELEPNSLGLALGFKPKDIIISINNILPISTKNRVMIYNNIIESKINDTIKVELVRDQKLDYIEYNLKTISNNKNVTVNSVDNNGVSSQSLEKLKDEYKGQSKILNNHKSSYTVSNNNIGNIKRFDALENNIKRQDKRSMLKYGKSGKI